MSAIDKVNAARANNRPTSIDYINKIFGDSFIELHGDRKFGDDKAIVGGIAKLNDMPVTVIGIEKGRNLKERMERNFGSAHPEGYRKALRLMKQAEKSDGLSSVSSIHQVHIVVLVLRSVVKVRQSPKILWK